MQSTDESVAWIEAAEQCQQAELRLACISRLVQRLIAKAPADCALASSIADAAQLKRCDKSTLLLVLGLVAGSGRNLIPRHQLLAYQPPSDGAIATSLEQAANPGSYEWRIEQFSQQPSQPGNALHSPWFMAAGRQWQIKLYPNGANNGVEGHISCECCPEQLLDFRPDKTGQHASAVSRSYLCYVACHCV